MEKVLSTATFFKDIANMVKGIEKLPYRCIWYAHEPAEKIFDAEFELGGDINDVDGFTYLDIFMQGDFLRKPNNENKLYIGTFKMPYDQESNSVMTILRDDVIMNADIYVRENRAYLIKRGYMCSKKGYEDIFTKSYSEAQAYIAHGYRVTDLEKQSPVTAIYDESKMLEMTSKISIKEIPLLSATPDKESEVTDTNDILDNTDMVVEEKESNEITEYEQSVEIDENTGNIEAIVREEQENIYTETLSVEENNENTEFLAIEEMPENAETDIDESEKYVDITQVMDIDELPAEADNELKAIVAFREKPLEDISAEDYYFDEDEENIPISNLADMVDYSVDVPAATEIKEEQQKALLDVGVIDLDERQDAPTPEEIVASLESSSENIEENKVLCDVLEELNDEFIPDDEPLIDTGKVESFIHDYKNKTHNQSKLKNNFIGDYDIEVSDDDDYDIQIGDEEFARRM